MKIEEISKEKAEVEIINSIKKKHKDLRQESKGYTFALTYNCIAKTLEQKFGANKEKAEKIYKAFHDLYHVSDEWVMQKMQSAFSSGYVTCAFGLRLRTPKMGKSMQSEITSNFTVGEEFRTAANALGQSYGLLNTRAGIEFNQSVRDSKYRLDIRPIGQIHDAQYFIIKNDPDVFIFCNNGLVKADSWQELDEIKHDQVHLGGELSIFYPTWGEEFAVPNYVSKEELLSLTDKYLESL
jgi:DNA polymerase-1